MLPVGPFRPDQPNTVPGIMRAEPQAGSSGSLALIEDAENGVALAPGDTFTPINTSASFPTTPLTYLTATTQAGSYVVFVLSSTHIYQMSATGVFTSIGSGYNCPAGDRWGACQFGSHAIFTNKNDGMLQYNIESGGAVTAIPNAPKARGIRAIFDVLMATDCDGDNKLMRNSDFDYTNWITGVSGYQPMPDGLELMGVEEIAEGTAIVFQRDRVRILNRVADQSLYVIQLLAANVGAVTPWCIVNAAGAAFFVDTNGFKSVSSSGIQRIGDGKVDRTHVANRTQAFINGFAGAFDPVREAVVWGMSPIGTSSITSDVMRYYIRIGEFLPELGSSGQFGFIMTSASPGYTMEDLDAFGNMDTITISLDDRFWYGGELQLGSISATTGEFGLFVQGDGTGVIFSMPDMMSGTRQLVTSYTPITDGPFNFTFGLNGYETLDNAATSSNTSNDVAQTTGTVSTRVVGRRFVLTISVPGIGGSVPVPTPNWTYFRGIDNVVMVDQGSAR